MHSSDSSGGDGFAEDRDDGWRAACRCAGVIVADAGAVEAPYGESGLDLVTVIALALVADARARSVPPADIALRALFARLDSRLDELLDVHATNWRALLLPTAELSRQVWANALAHARRVTDAARLVALGDSVRLGDRVRVPHPGQPGDFPAEVIDVIWRAATDDPDLFMIRFDGRITTEPVAAEEVLLDVDPANLERGALALTLARRCAVADLHRAIKLLNVQSVEQVATELGGRVSRYRPYPQIQNQVMAVAAAALAVPPTRPEFVQMLTATQQALTSPDELA